MLELIRTVKVVGLRPMLQLRRAQRIAWPGMLNGFYATRVMLTLFNVGFFDELTENGSIDPEEFAIARQLDVAVLRSLCDALFAHKVLDRRGEKYALGRNGRSLVGVGRGWFEAVHGYQHLINGLEAVLRKERTYEQDVTRRAVYVARGSAAIEARLYFPLAIDYIRRNGFRKALDLGCGDGTFLRRLCLSAPGVTGCGVDVSAEAIADGTARTQAEGLADRVHLFTEDISKLVELPAAVSGIDVATTFFVLHELLYSGAPRVIEFLKGFRRNFPSVPLLVFEVDRPTPEEMRRRPGMAIPYYLQHDLSHQKPIARREWLPMFQAAGFQSIQERHLAFARSVIFTLR